MLFIGIIGGINDISFATGYILMVLAILSLSTISYDEANHGLNTLFTLPISKSDYVKEKIFVFFDYYRDWFCACHNIRLF